MANMPTNKEQDEAHGHNFEGHHLLITGQAGTGKTQTIKCVYYDMKAFDKNIAPLCTTGMGCLQYVDMGAATVHSLACFHCTGKDSLSRCRGFINCKDTEKNCFLQMTNLGSTYSYTGGCMTDAVCQRLSGVDAGGSCIQCCNSSFCNNDTHLCGITATTPTPMPASTTTPIITSSLGSTASTSPSFGPQCYSCRNLTNPSDCHSSLACFKDEVCLSEALMATDGTITYHGSCAKRQECPAINGKKRSIYNRGRKSSNALNRREATLCYECCDSDFCNRHLCGSGATSSAPPAATATAARPMTTTTATTTSSLASSTAPLPCVDNPNVHCSVVAPDVCGKDDHFTFNLCRKTCGSCH